jgi:putative membrane protein
VTDVPIHPTINTCFNLLSFVFLCIGRAQIARKDVAAHKRSMIAAGVASACFLIGYVSHYVWRASVTGEPITRYPDVGALKWVYLGILTTHSVVALPLFAWFVPRTFFLALKGRFDEHRRIARFTFPVWVFVSLSGVVVYLMLYPFRPSAGPG